jgi:transcriptional regulator with XRE-family HTH domain
MSDDIDFAHISTRSDFARELTAVRERAGLTIRKVSSEAGLSVATVGDYFSGAHLPSATSLSAILAAIGVDGPEEVAAWRTALTRVRRRPGLRPSAAHPPYRGLAGYQTEGSSSRDWSPPARRSSWGCGPTSTPARLPIRSWPGWRRTGRWSSGR